MAAAFSLISEATQVASLIVAGVALLGASLVFLGTLIERRRA
jgi:hypothetical protein